MTQRRMVLEIGELIFLNDTLLVQRSRMVLITLEIDASSFSKNKLDILQSPVLRFWNAFNIYLNISLFIINKSWPANATDN